MSAHRVDGLLSRAEPRGAAAAPWMTSRARYTTPEGCTALPPRTAATAASTAPIT